MPGEWREWDGLSGIVSQAEMEATKMIAYEFEEDTAGRKFYSPVPPTSTSPSRAVVSESTPGDSGGDAIDQRCQKGSPATKLDLSSSPVVMGWGTLAVRLC